MDKATPSQHQKIAPDLLIVGGGLTGMLLAIALKNTPYRILLCDKAKAAEKVTPHFDARSIALNRTSQNILKKLGLWDELYPFATPIKTIHVSSKGQFGCTQLKARPDESLGVVVEIHRLHDALNNALSSLPILFETHLTSFNPEMREVTFSRQDESLSFTPQLLVAADGTNSTLRRLTQCPAQTKSYQQFALVANIGLKRPHHFQAFEYFTPYGPLALLPLEGNRMSLVWCNTPAETERLLNLSKQAFLKTLQDTFGYRLGRLTEVGNRMTFPLQQLVMPNLTAKSLVFIGNAAQTLHPIAAQGLNLGLRDAMTLAACITDQGLSEVMLKTYQAKREDDRQTIIRATDLLVRLFQYGIPPLPLLRQLALFAFDQSTLLKSTLIRYASGIMSCT